MFFIYLYIFYFSVFLETTLLFVFLASSVKIRRKLKISLHNFASNLIQTPNWLCFSSSINIFWLLFYWRFKNTFYGRGKYIYVHILWTTYIYSYPMNIFLWTWSFSMKFSIMTSPRYYDVTHFLTDPNEICTAYVKLETRYFVRENFLIFRIFIEKIMINYENLVYCPVTLHLSPISFGPPIRVGSVRDTSFTYLRIFFQHTKNSFYLNWWKKQRRSLTPLWRY